MAEIVVNEKPLSKIPDDELAGFVICQEWELTAWDADGSIDERAGIYTLHLSGHDLKRYIKAHYEWKRGNDWKAGRECGSHLCPTGEPFILPVKTEIERQLHALHDNDKYGMDRPRELELVQA